MSDRIPTRKRRVLKSRVLKSLFASALTFAAGGWAAAEYGGLSLDTLGLAHAKNAESSSLDAIEQAWEGGELTSPVAKANAAAARDEPIADPFLAAAASSENAAASDNASLVARGQQPGGGALDIEVATELPAGNPLRGRYAPARDANQQALARQFGEGRYGVESAGGYRTPNEANAGQPIRVEIGPESRVEQAAAEDALPPNTLRQEPADFPPALTPTAPPELAPPESSAAAEEAFRDPFVAEQPLAEQPVFDSSPPELPPALTEPTPEPAPALPPEAVSPLVDMPIEPPAVDPSTVESPAAELAPIAPPSVEPRVATRQPAFGASPPMPTGQQELEPIEEYTLQSQPTAFGKQPESTLAAPRPGDPSLEGRQQPSLAVQKFAPETTAVGVPCKFMIKVRNDSPRAVADVVVNDRTPSGAELVATTPSAETRGDAVRWAIGTLGPGEERTLEMEVVPNEEGEIGSVATVSFTAQASAKTSVTRPQLALRISAPALVMVGQEQRLRVEVRNPGTGDASNVVLIEDVPSNLRHEAGPTLEFDVGTLRAGETRQLELVMDAEAPGAVQNVMTARADGGLEVRQQVDFEVVAPALTVAVDGPGRRYLQRPATYKLRIDNPGTAAARDIRLTARLPRGMKFVKANNLGEYDPSTHAVYWALAELPEGAGGEVEVTALPTAAGEMTIEAEGEAQPGLKDAASHRVRVEGIAAVDFQVLDVEDPIEVGGQTEYEVRVDNQGTKEATGVRVRFVSPPGMRVLSAKGPTRHTIDSRGVTFEPIARLAPRGEDRFRVRVQADTAGDQRMTVEVTTDDLTQPVRKEEATRVFGDE